MKICLPLLGLLLSASLARAEVRIAPGSRNSEQLSATSTSLSVEVNTKARLARIVSTSVFANQSPNDFEGEFVAQAPPNSIITQFSYWYKGQKTLARIVENARAARIYSEATSAYRPHDPALVEMLERNKFRVRIAPIEALKPLQIEIVWWQPLEKVGKEWRLSLPWRDKSRAYASESLDLKVHFLTPVQNLDSPSPEVKITPQSLELSQASGSSDVPANATFSFESTKKAVMLQSRSRGDAYFVAVVPESVGKNWEVWRLCYSVHSHALGDGQRIVTGRYAKNSPGRAIGYSTETNVEASEKWWASLELDDMARHPQTTTSINSLIECSKRYGLPSQWTSWLAIPDSERQKMADIIDREKITKAYYDRMRLASALAQWRMNGKTNAPQYRSMIADFNAATLLAGRDKSRPLDPPTLHDFFVKLAQNQLSYMGDGGDTASAQMYRKNLLNLLQGDASATSVKLKKQADTRIATLLRRDAATLQVKTLTNQAVNALLAGRTGEDYGSKIRQAVPHDIEGTSRLYAEIQRVADEAVKTRRSRPTVSQQLEDVLAALLETSYSYSTIGATKNDILFEAESRVFGQQLASLKAALAQEIADHREDGPSYQQLRQQLDDQLAQSQTRFQNAEPALAPTIRKTQLKLLQLQGAAQLDAAAVAQTQDELKRLSQFVSPATFEQAVKDTDTWVSYEGVRYMAPQWLTAVKQGGADSPDAVRIKSEIQKLLDAQFAKQYYKDHPESYKAEIPLRDAEMKALAASTTSLYEQLAQERSEPQLNEAKIAELLAQLKAIEEASVYNKTTLTDWVKPHNWMVYERVIAKLNAEVEEPAPDTKALEGLSERLAEVAPGNDSIYKHFWTGSDQNELRGTPQDYARLRVRRLTLRAQAEAKAARLAKNPPLATRRALRQEIAQWKQMDNQLRVRMGDPLIAVKAPQNARQVLAIFPGGELKKLEWNAQNRQWEARFDVPTWANEGDYTVQIVVVFGSGARQKLTMKFAVDVRAPEGKGSLQSEGQSWKLSLQTDELTDRVSAFLPWNDRVELRRDSGNTFVADVPLPSDFKTEQTVVRFVLTDKAHNRTELLVDWNK